MTLLTISVSFSNVTYATLEESFQESLIQELQSLEIKDMSQQIDQRAED
jgi:hypothetical protein